MTRKSMRRWSILGLFMGLVLTGLGANESQAQDTQQYFSGHIGVSRVWVAPSTGLRSADALFLMAEYQWVYKDRVGVVPFVRTNIINGFDGGITLRVYPGDGFYFGGGVTSNVFQTFRWQQSCVWACNQVYYHVEGPGQIVTLGKVLENGLSIQINYQNMRQEMIEYMNNSSRAVTLRENVPYTRGDVSVGIRF
ncbi:MAG: hypothetical protein OEV94_02725 [Deltaproteobacteria bacterium]|nr:hypothetical protein [Deltaproteobacteria bacterium]